MAQVTDPVCGMTVDSDKAAASSRYAGDEFFFCSMECKREFDENPSRYRNNTALADKADEQSKFTSPRFGSATSGGGEFEPLPPDTRD
jgi:Cu+-exporting ATPase